MARKSEKRSRRDLKALASIEFERVEAMAGQDAKVELEDRLKEFSAAVRLATTVLRRHKSEMMEHARAAELEQIDVLDYLAAAEYYATSLKRMIHDARMRYACALATTLVKETLTGPPAAPGVTP